MKSSSIVQADRGEAPGRVRETPTVALVVQQGVFARVLLQTDVVDTLLQSGVRLIVLTPEPETVRRYLQGRGLSQIEVEQLDVVRYRSQERGLIKALFRHLRAYGIRTTTVDGIFEMEWRDAWSQRVLGTLLLLAVTWIVTRLMRASGLVAKWVVALENRVDTPNVLAAFIRRHAPQAMVVSSTGTFDYDRYVIREAKRHGVRVVSYVQSWDNTTVRGLGVNLSDQHIVWSDVMKDELVDLHRVDPERVAVEGVPHYDVYADGKASIMGKEELAQEFGFDPAKRLLLLGTKSPNTFLYNADVASVICQAIREGRLPPDCHLIARLHPIYFRRRGGHYVYQDDWAEWDDLLSKYGSEIVSVDRPAMEAGQLNLLMPDREIPKLAALLKHSAVVVNMFSTLNLEASIFDTPIVNVAFNFGHKRPKGTKVARFDLRYDEFQTHNQRVVQSGGTTLARSPEDLIEHINLYLENPQMHADGRRRIVANECGVNLGQAGRAVGKAILDCIPGGYR